MVQMVNELPRIDSGWRIWPGVRKPLGLKLPTGCLPALGQLLFGRVSIHASLVFSCTTPRCSCSSANRATRGGGYATRGHQSFRPMAI